VATVWRLIVEDRGFDGAWNMALDRAIQISHARGDSPPTLRLYAWARPTVTLGRFQSEDDVDLRLCADQGIDVARRYTGGRGVLHDDEVTYSVIAGIADGVPRGTTASYRFLCAALVQAYQRLGVPAALTSRPRGEPSSAACYLHATHADVSLGALKLSGSAQVWHHDTVLQHGSFVIGRDLDREAAVFGLTCEDTRSLGSVTVTLGASLGTTPSRQSVSAAVCDAFEDALGVRLLRGDIEPGELSTAAGLFGETGILVHEPVRPSGTDIQA
jgi:lipoate-protein ligase A